MARTFAQRERACNRRLFLEAAAAAIAGGVALDSAKPWRGRCEGGQPGTNRRTRCLVLYQSGETWEELQGERGSGKELSDLGLIGKGISAVHFEGKTYRVDREGLYRFMLLPKNLRNLISLRDNRSLIPLLMALSSLQVHGNRHDPESIEALKKRLPVDPWVSITCGKIAQLARSILSDEGYKTRMIGCSTLEEPNGYNDGHAIFEVYWPEAGKWIVVDADMGLLFKDHGAFLSAEELAGFVKKNKRPEFFSLAQKAAVLDPFFLGPDGYNYALEFRWLWGTPEGKWQWYRRVLGRIAVL